MWSTQFSTLMIHLILLLIIYPSSSFQTPKISKYQKHILHISGNDVEYKEIIEHDKPFENEASPFNRRSFIISSTLLATSSFISNVKCARAEEEGAPIASFALRRTGALLPSVANLPPNKLGIFARFTEGFLYSDDASRTPGKDITASFYFPTDWLQLDRILGGVQYVDQRNGDKLYVLKVLLPKGVDNLKDVPKAYFGDAIFNPKGELIRTGNDVEDYKVLSSSMTETALDEPQRRRLKVRYTTVTGNNLSIERKGLVDIYEVGGMCYMLMTGSNAVRFDKMGIERDVVEYIANSFRVIPVKKLT